jgi:hypothetical protein
LDLTSECFEKVPDLDTDIAGLVQLAVAKLFEHRVLHLEPPTLAKREIANSLEHLLHAIGIIAKEFYWCPVSFRGIRGCESYCFIDIRVVKASRIGNYVVNLNFG